MEGYITVKDAARFEYEEKKSVFIGEAMPVSCEADAIAFIDAAKKRYPDAKHHVYAYVLRENSIMRFSDDREPQGTAGMPALDVIRKNNCTDTVIVVTRYFGGTLLGTGGLVRAYTAAALGALNAAEIIRYDTYCDYSITVNYADYGRASTLISDLGFRVDNIQYAEDITIFGSILKSSSRELEETLTDLTSARAKYKMLQEKFDY